ncbi:MAG TPA: thiamine phosphate synthase, partial [Planctomycetia bacterium]|nr:thiamine phosphate synthase [Planctomycetia bacterium]
TEDDDGEELPVPSLAVTRVLGLARETSMATAGDPDAGTEELLLALFEGWPEGASLFARHGLAAAELAEEYRRRHVQIPAEEPSGEPAVIEWDPGDDRLDVARVVDANANRAREALRTLEDFARFILDDAGLCERLKNCRHRLREALEFLPYDWAIAARETEGDVGAAISLDDEIQRPNLGAVLAANAKRASEALRALEEYAKLSDSQAARRLETLRYEVYTLERSLRIGQRSRRRLDGVVLYWLFDPHACRKTIEWTVKEALEGGVQVVQLRDKQSTDRERIERALQIRQWTDAAGALFIVNDRPDIARLVRADGVHLGQEDMTVRAARRILGPGGLIGVSTHEVAQVSRAVSEGADYLGIGPVFPSSTKDFADFPGLDFVRAASRLTTLPSFCIGGVHAENASDVLAAGGRRIAVSAAISRSEEPALAARSLRAALDR